MECIDDNMSEQKPKYRLPPRLYRTVPAQKLYPHVLMVRPQAPSGSDVKCLSSLQYICSVSQKNKSWNCSHNFPKY